MTELYITNINEIENFDKLVKKLPKERQERISKFRKIEDKLASLASGLFINKLAKDKPIKLTSYGKPYIENGPHFSISHSKDYVIMAVDSKNIGCDIEYNNDVAIKNIGKYAFHPQEFEYWSSMNFKTSLFYKLWTLKESYLKLVGKGLLLPPQSVCIDFDKEIKILKTPEKDFTDCKFKISEQIKDYTIAICHNSDNSEINFKKIILK
ncbi:MAG: 4'-phosphopantetheinyl transferase superfamily protein [bacterium]|nr:4'-phosphopantetheinyl transferase superfamily protein [bacterium]